MEFLLGYINYLLYEVAYWKVALFIAVFIAFIYISFMELQYYNTTKNFKKLIVNNSTKLKKYLKELEKKYLEKKGYLFFVYLEVAYKKFLSFKYKNNYIIDGKDYRKLSNILNKEELRLVKEIDREMKICSKYGGDSSYIYIPGRKSILDRIRKNI